MTAKTTILTRLFDAPRELVFECWLKPEHLLHWYSAGGGWTTPYAETDPKTGGRFKIGFAAPDGKGSFDFTGTYSEVKPPERIVIMIDDGRPVTVDFTEQNGKTLVTLTLTLETTHSEEQQRHGWGAMLENLNTYLEKESSMTTVNAYLNFRDTCEEAFKAYEKILGGKIIAMVKADTPDMGGPDFMGKIMHARMMIGTAVLMGSDSPHNREHTPQGFAVNVTAETPAEADRIYAALAQGGQQMMPIAETFWAHRFGMCVDCFGTPWMVNCEKPNMGRP